MTLQIILKNLCKRKWCQRVNEKNVFLEYLDVSQAPPLIPCLGSGSNHVGNGNNFTIKPTPPQRLNRWRWKIASVDLSTVRGGFGEEINFSCFVSLSY